MRGMMRSTQSVGFLKRRCEWYLRVNILMLIIKLILYFFMNVSLFNYGITI